MSGGRGNERYGPGLRKGVIALCIPAALIILFYSLSSDKALMEKVFEKFTLPVRNFFGGMWSFLPFSMAELFYVLLTVLAVVFLIRTAWLLILRPGRLQTLIRRVFLLALTALYIWTGFCWLWSVGYYGESFAEKSGLDAEGVTVEDLTRVTEYFAEKANELSLAVPRGEDMLFTTDMTAYFDGYDSVYDNIEESFPFLKADTFAPKKFYFSRILSYIGFTGFYFPLTGETNINTDAPSCLIPATIAHEMAHQRGVSGEAEANFTAVAACLTSDDVGFQYSGCLLGYINLMNALYKADRDAWSRLRSSFTAELEADWKYNNAYWAQLSDSVVSKTSNRVYDSFLKVNTQQLGIESYGACVDLIVQWLS